jgi:hypothetical protein
LSGLADFAGGETFLGAGLRSGVAAVAVSGFAAVDFFAEGLGRLRVGAGSDLFSACFDRDFFISSRFPVGDRDAC